MPYRLLAASELAEFLRALAHPRRIQILEELRNGERDVASLAQATGLAHSSVSQHLMVLRAHRVVAEHREGSGGFIDVGPKIWQIGWCKEGTSCHPWNNEQTNCRKQSTTQIPDGPIAQRLMRPCRLGGQFHETV